MRNSKVISSALNKINNDFIKALTEPTRMTILKIMVCNGSCDVKTLSDQLPQDRSVISRHLSFMEKAGILNSVKQGKHVIYSVNGENTLQQAEQLVDSIRTCLKHGCC